MRISLPLLTLLGMVALPVGLLLEATRDPAVVVIAAEKHQLRFDLHSTDGENSLWSIPGGVHGVFSKAPAEQVMLLPDGAIGLREESVRAFAAVSSLKSVGASAVRNAVLFEPHRVAPAELRRSTTLSTVLSDGERTLEVPWHAPAGMLAVSGAVHRIIGAAATPPVIVAIAPQDEELAIRLASEVEELLGLFPAHARSSIRETLPPQLIVSNWDDLDLADGDYEGPFANVWIGPLPPGSVTSLAQLGRLVARGVLARGDRLQVPSVTVAAVAWADLATRTLRGRTPWVLEDALERQAHRAARTVEWDRYATGLLVDDLDAARLIALVGAQPFSRLEARLTAAAQGSELRAVLGSWLMSSPTDAELASLLDLDEVKRAALQTIAANSCIDPIRTQKELHANRTHWEFVGEHGGYLETCGCKSTEGGGFIDLVARWSRPPEVGTRRILLGNELSTPDRSSHVSGANGLILDGMRDMHLTAFVPAVLEFAALATRGIELHQLDSLPVICCNVIDRNSGGLVFPPFVDVPAEGGLPAARVIGVARIQLRHSVPFVREPAEAVYGFLDPIAPILTAIATAPAEMDIVLAGDLVPVDLQRLAQATARPILAISRELMVPRLANGLIERQQVDGHVAATAVVFSSGAAYHLVTASHDPRSTEVVTKSERLADREVDPDVLTTFKGRIQQVLEREQPAVELAFAETNLAPSRTYVGSEVCGSCHDAEFAQWLTTPHASAMLTLERVQRQRIRNCVACHVVGYGLESGYEFDAPRAELRNVGCEVCHGPGSEHIAGVADAIRRTPSNDLCAACHTEAHSNFLLSAPQAYRSRIDHSSTGVGR